jgi:hypothetical protein
VARVDKIIEVNASGVRKFHKNHSMMGALPLISRNPSLQASTLSSALEERCCN